VFCTSAFMLASGPVTTLSTPGGSFSAMRCTTRAVASGAVSAGFTITVLPASSACGSEVRVQQFDGTRQMDFHPLPERRLIIHLSGEVEIGTSDGSRHVFRAGDIRLMEDVTGRGHTHVDRSPSSAVYILLKD
jgi:hypothetical protein